VIPFDYPGQAIRRRHDPHGYVDVTSFRPWLRDEFVFRCVYCLRRERWEPDASVFEIDHIRPTSRFPALAVIYDNLVYSCTACNSAKSGQEVPDPTRVFIASKVTVERDGRLTPHDPEARRLILELDLNDPEFVLWRFRMIQIVELAARHEPALYHSLLAYPDSLPNLSVLRPPGGNSRPEGVEQSHFRRRERGELAATY
jgi:HNH endonuclease